MIKSVRLSTSMIKRSILISLMILVAVISAAPSFALTIASPEAQLKITAPKKQSVSSLVTAIEIRGNLTVQEESIMDGVFSRIGDILIEEKVTSDLKAIYSLGYFEDVTASFEPYAGGTRILFNVRENPKIKDIVFEGNTVYSSKDMLSLMRTKAGSVLNFKVLQDDIKILNDKYKNDGYSLARIADISTDPKTKVLKIKIIEGVIESIALDGNKVTRDYVILREIDTKPGMVLNEKALAKDLRRVFNLGFFSEIRPDFEPGSSPDKVILVIKIGETKSSTINFGGGFGEREGWFGFVDLNLNNLLGTGHNSMIRGQWGKLTTYQFKYTYPWFLPETFGPRTTMSYRLWNTAGPDFYGTELQNATRIGWDIALSRPFRENFSHSVAFGSETVRPLPSTDDTTPDPSFEAYVSDFVSYTLSYDTRDFWMNPSEGKFYSASVRRGWKQTDHITNYTKLGLDMNEFIKLADKQVLALHMGTGIGFGDVPLGELYWCGGANTVRGYFPSEAVLGVRKLIFNVEYRYTFNEMFQGVLFYDYGNAWGDVLSEKASGSAPNFSTFLSGRGLGLRLNTPLGPIRLDYGIGASRSFGEGIVHFSIGQAF